MNDLLALNPEVLAQVLFEQGYYPISCRYEMAARIDRADWKEFMVSQGYSRLSIGAGEQYARVYSKDVHERIGRKAYRKLRDLWNGKDAEFKELPK